ncbi:MAG: class I SAM-dependent methyltransferase [Alkalibacterium thalassium]|nr:class I SAM-dependent methyltransferase [Alkalibacterium thalassium]
MAKCTSKFGDLHKEVLLTPTILSLLEDVGGQKILDAGCGEGYFSRLLAEKGAYVTAVDFSARMLDIARERTSNDAAIDYRQANLEDLNELESSLFDQVMSNMAIQDVAHLDAVLGEVHRVLKPGRDILSFRFFTPVSSHLKVAGIEMNMEMVFTGRRITTLKKGSLSSGSGQKKEFSASTGH